MNVNVQIENMLLVATMFEFCLHMAASGDGSRKDLCCVPGKSPMRITDSWVFVSVGWNMELGMSQPEQGAVFGVSCKLFESRTLNLCICLHGRPGPEVASK